METQLAVPAQVESAVTRWKISVADYHRMGELGIFRPGERVELIDGEVYRMSPIGTIHAAMVRRFDRLVNLQVGEKALVSPQNPIVLNDLTEPEPDIALLRYREDFYEHATPTAADVLLVIEVSDSTLAFDRQTKLPHYARAGIPEVWITDVAGEAIERYTEPHADQYATKRTFRSGQTVSAQALPTISLSVDSLFG